MTTLPLLLLNLLASSHSSPDPDDTHIHVHLPPEGEQGNSFASFSSVSLKGETPKTGGGFVENGGQR